MPYVSPEEVREAKKMDLLTYLYNYEPDELVRIAGNTYCTREHDSLKISNGMWHWFSRGCGGKTALDYLIKVENYSFPDAVETILGKIAEKSPVVAPSQEAISMPTMAILPKKRKNTKFVLPKMTSPYKAIDYLLKRGIDFEIITHCLLNGLLFETEQYHNAAFVGYDREGIARYAALRGTVSKFKSEAPGSDKRYAFSIPSEAESDTVHLFEGAIDAMSYATLLKMTGRDWRKDTLLSLAGVSRSAKEPRVPCALEHYLSEHPDTKTLLLHLDNDKAGRGAASSIISLLGDKYRVIDSPAPTGKDVNDYLIQRIERHRKKEEHERC